MIVRRVVLGFIIVSMLGVICIIINKRKTAVRLAEDYLRQKYTFQVKCLSVRRSLEPGLYHVFFSPLDEPELKIEVRIQQDLSVPKDRENEYGYYVPDNYFPALFRLNTERFFSPKIQKIWDPVNIGVYISVNTSSMYSFRVPIELNEQMEPIDMEPYLKYDIIINIESLFTNIKKEEEAVKFIQTFEIIKDVGYKPEKIFFFYKSGTKERENYFVFENWQNISTVSHIIATRGSRY